VSIDDRDTKQEAAAQEHTLPVEDLNPKKVDGAKADAIKGGATDQEANSEKIKR
jgi:hypothetical protein